MSTQPGDQTIVMPPARGAATPGSSSTPAPGPQSGPDPAAVQELDRQLNLNDEVLRTKVLRPELR